MPDPGTSPTAPESAAQAPSAPVPIPEPPSVPKGLQTWLGYGSAAAGVVAVAVLAILQAADEGSIDLPPWLYGLLLAGSYVLTATTGRNRSDQAVARQDAAAVAAIGARAPATPAPVVVIAPAAAVDSSAPPAEEGDDLPEPDATFEVRP